VRDENVQQSPGTGVQMTAWRLRQQAIVVTHRPISERPPIKALAHLKEELRDTAHKYIQDPKAFAVAFCC
jgi:hypothetical protein